jgi:hypothetical protein
MAAEEAKATLDSRIAARVRWGFLRNGITRKARLSPKLALRLSSAKLSDITAIFRPEHTAEKNTKTNT